MNRFKTAIDIQDACNMRAIAREFVRVVDAAMEETRDTGKTWTDPAVVMFVNKLESLSRSEANFSAAYADWAVGWVEWIAIHSIDTAALTIADQIQERLQDYPVIDEDHWSALEHDEAQETWANCYNDRERLAYVREHRSQFDFHDYADLIGCVRGRYFCGYACELLH